MLTVSERGLIVLREAAANQRGRRVIVDPADLHECHSLAAMGLIEDYFECSDGFVCALITQAGLDYLSIAPTEDGLWFLKWNSVQAGRRSN